jgi:hypothetical protein
VLSTRTQRLGFGALGSLGAGMASQLWFSGRMGWRGFGVLNIVKLSRIDDREHATTGTGEPVPVSGRTGRS